MGLFDKAWDFVSDNVPLIKAGVAAAKATREIFDKDGNSMGTIIEMDDGTFRNDSGQTVDENGNIVADTSGSLGSGTFDIDWTDLLGTAAASILADNPEMDYDKIIELAMQQSVMNSPNLYTPQGQTITTWNEETGQPDVRQTYSPEIQNLYEGLVATAGGPVESYKAPERMTGGMLNRYINDRDRHQRLTMPSKNYWDEEDE